MPKTEPKNLADELILSEGLGSGFGDDAAGGFAKVDPVPRKLGHHRKPGTEFPGHKSPRREPGDCDVVCGRGLLSIFGPRSGRPAPRAAWLAVWPANPPSPGSRRGAFIDPSSPADGFKRYPHGESNPGFRTENPTSWATRRWGLIPETFASANIVLAVSAGESSELERPTGGAGSFVFFSSPALFRDGTETTALIGPDRS